MNRLSKKTILMFFLILLSFILIISILKIFIASLSPSEKARSARSQYDISKLKNGDFIFESLKRRRAWDEKVLIIKDWSGNIYTHLVPEKNEMVTMPEPFWGRGYYKCKNFGPEINSTGQIKKDGIIKCHDAKAPEWMSEHQWKWKYSGKALGSWVGDMYSPSYEISDYILYING